MNLTTKTTRTYAPKASELQKNWRVVDATNRPLGRLASEVAQILKGKDKPTYTPHMDTGDFVIVVNAAKVQVTGNKTKKKIYYTHSMYPGGLKATNFEAMLERHPRRVIEWAVWGMLPKNRLGRSLFRNLKVYSEETHPHSAQIKDHAGPEKVGKPGRPRPPKKIRVRSVGEASVPASENAATPAETVSPELPTQKQPRKRQTAARTPESQADPIKPAEAALTPDTQASVEPRKRGGATTKAKRTPTAKLDGKPSRSLPETPKSGTRSSNAKAAKAQQQPKPSRKQRSPKKTQSSAGSAGEEA